MAKMFPPPILLYVMLSYDNKIIIQATPKTINVLQTFNERDQHKSIGNVTVPIFFDNI